ncbi:uncharacterized protein F21D5.5 isoform X2 [Zootermopsis nevadensis]|uniref:uncharacterized protein F21D5.5 isoform X2 n=1 Tax=Zootermopsis nevadensis TaxID=136037 RepID=UPI000B8E56F4|nr:uncharacterized protein F21D5.5 isoform X2 [Zootermopsis nevadensis]
MATIRRCILRCINNSHEPIVLPHMEEVFIGRAPNTKITDKKCSRNQVSLCADISALEVRIKQVGPNTTGVNGFALKKSGTQVLRHGDKLEILLGQYIHIVEFEPPPSVDGNKRKLDETSILNKKLCGESLEKDSGLATPKTSSDSKWETIDNGKLLIYTSKHVVAQSKIAAYDLDGTIIVTQSGHVFPKDCNDWKIAFSEVPGKLKQLHNDGYKIVFLTNQAGIGRGSLNLEDFKAKVVRIVNKLGVPVQTFISTGKGIYRKPAPGMWNALKNCDVPVDVSKSFYCGDAAGREANWAPKKKKDFSSSDRLMALNLGLKFYTPEEHFLQQRPATFKLPDFNPSILQTDLPLYEPCDIKLISDTKEVVVLVGSPGSGKSFFASTYLVPEGYHHVNRDTLGSLQKCMSTLESALAAGKSVIIDNTNPDKESRQKFISAARKHGVMCRCFVLKTSIEHAKHNNKFREYTDDNHEPISDMIINMYKKKYVEPNQDEGFDDIVKINFIPKFNVPELEKLYKMYLLEK